jgi:hypothetical protein
MAEHAVCMPIVQSRERRAYPRAAPPTSVNTTATQEGPVLTPAEVCLRWRIDLRTLDKIDLPWIRLTERVRRIPLSVVMTYEQAQRMTT